MKYIGQIFTGGWNIRNYPTEDIIERLKVITAKIPLEKVIIGWNTDPEIYRKTGEWLHANGIKMLLWLPVFSETGELRAADEALDIFQKPAGNLALQEGENFTFYCPSSERNIQNVFDIYEEYYSGCGFDGVFLDKIRSQSFVSGTGGVLSCCCPRCEAEYAGYGVSLKQFRASFEEKKDRIFDSSGYAEGKGFVYVHPETENYFAAKEKIIAASGLMSRRAAEELIEAGKVCVNGAVASLGDKADAERDKITVNGKSLAPAEEKVYIMLNKPRGYVTTLKDEKGRRTVAELVSGLSLRLYPVGRLDMNSEGLLIMTNDGELADRLMHPRGGVEKCYRTTVTGENIPTAAEKLKESMLIDGYRTRGARVEIEKLTDGGGVLLITISEGRNRQVRKMCEQAGLRVTRLCRISEGGLKLGTLKSGTWRELTRAEIARLKRTEQENENI